MADLGIPYERGVAGSREGAEAILPCGQLLRFDASLKLQAAPEEDLRLLGVRQRKILQVARSHIVECARGN